MGKLEWIIFVLSNACVILLVKYFNALWSLVGNASTSFVAQLYYSAIGLLVIGSIVAMFFDYCLVSDLMKKLKNK